METTPATTKPKAAPRTKPAAAQQKLLNISQLAFRFDLDRATIRKRLMAAGIVPEIDDEKEKLFRLDEDIVAVLDAQDDPLDAEKLRKLSAEADIKQIEAQQKRGEMCSVAEFTQAVQQIFGSLHKKLAVQTVNDLSAKLVKCKTQAEVKKIMSARIDRVFDELRTDHAKFLGVPAKRAKGK